MDREEVRPLHECQAANAERGEERELTSADPERVTSRREDDEHQSDERAGRTYLRQPLRADSVVLYHLDDRRVDREQRRGDRDHHVPGCGGAPHARERIPP